MDNDVHVILLTGAGEFDLVESGKRNRAFRYFWVAFAMGIVAGLLLTVGAQRNATSAAGAFFGGGSLLLIAGLSLCSGCLWLLKKSQAAEKLSLLGMGVRNVTRRQRRSLTTLGLLASGHSRERILKAYPYLEPEDIDAVLAYAAWRMEEREEALVVP